jgi:hypothetical protein
VRPFLCDYLLVRAENVPIADRGASLTGVQRFKHPLELHEPAHGSLLIRASGASGRQVPCSGSGIVKRSGIFSLAVAGGVGLLGIAGCTEDNNQAIGRVSVAPGAVKSSEASKAQAEETAKNPYGPGVKAPPRKGGMPRGAGGPPPGAPPS